jgi:hypothetical protein
VSNSAVGACTHWLFFLFLFLLFLLFLAWDNFPSTRACTPMFVFFWGHIVYYCGISFHCLYFDTGFMHALCVYLLCFCTCNFCRFSRCVRVHVSRLRPNPKVSHQHSVSQSGERSIFESFIFRNFDFPSLLIDFNWAHYYSLIFCLGNYSTIVVVIVIVIFQLL